MDHEQYEAGACAASDLTARFLAELAQAHGRMAVAEANFRAATAGASPVPQVVRIERRSCRRQIALLRLVLAGMPSVEGACHAESA